MNNNKKENNLDHLQINNPRANSQVSMVSESFLKNQESPDKRNTMFIIFNIIIGQLLALIGIANGTFSKVIEKDLKYVTPLLMTSSYYLLLAIVWLSINRTLKFPKFIYVLITIFDSQANFLNIYAFSVVNFSYPFIINISSVFWTCLFTWIFIKAYRYKKIHIIGVSLSLLGVGITLLGALRLVDEKDKLFDNMKGLIYCLAASILYSISSILQEIYFKSGKDIYEFFPWLGIIGCSLTLLESFALQEIYKVAYEFEFTFKIALLWAGFAITIVIFTSIAPFFIKRCSASMFNISLVSQIFWSYLVEVIFGESGAKGFEFYIGFIIIILGIYVFNKFPVDLIKNLNEDESRRNSDIEHKNMLQQNLLNNEDGSKTGSVKNIIVDNISEHSSTSAFSKERKYNYNRNPTLSSKANQYLNHTIK